MFRHVDEFAGSFFSLSVIMWCVPSVKERSNPWLARFSQGINGWKKIRSHRSGIFQTVILLILNIVLVTVTTILEYRILGLELDLSRALFLAILPAFSSIVSVTPGNLGIREALSVLTGIVVNIPIPVVLASGLLDRVATVSLSFFWGAVYYPLLARNMSMADRK